MAEGVGFEPTVSCETTVFKTVAFGHSATPPMGAVRDRTGVLGRGNIVRQRGRVKAERGMVREGEDGGWEVVAQDTDEGARMSALRSLLVVGALLAGTARGQTARVGSGGGLAISYGGMDTFLGDSVLLMDEKWQALDSPLRAKPKVTRTTGKVVATYESPLGQVVRTVVSGPPVVVT